MPKNLKALALMIAAASLLLCVCACSAEEPSAETNTDIVCTLTEEELEAYSYLPQITEVMPTVHINTADSSNEFATKYMRQDKLDDLIEYVDATITVADCDEEYLISDAKAEVKVRGNYTLEYSKKPLRIKFAEKQNMVGLHGGEKYKNWVLLADWKDLSMTNNSIAFYLGKTILGSDGYYCTDYRNVEVYINGNYWGVYLLAEQQEVKDGRMSVPEVDDDYTGTDIGYMFEYDGYYTDERDMPNGSGDPTFEVDHDRISNFQPGYTVKSDINDDAQLEFIQSYTENIYKIAKHSVKNDLHFKFNESYTAIEQFDGVSVYDTVSEVIDLQSLVDVYILNEICCDPDIGWSSFYMSVDMTEDGNKKLTFEAPWDFDSAFGIKYGYDSPDRAFVATTENPWLLVFSNEPWFVDMVKEKWNEMKQAGVQDTALSLVQQYKTVYKDHYERNYERWEERVKFGNHELINTLNSYKTQGQASDYLYNWLEKRFECLDKRWA